MKTLILLLLGLGAKSTVTQPQRPLFTIENNTFCGSITFKVEGYAPHTYVIKETFVDANGNRFEP